MAFELLIIALLVGLNGLLALTELAVVSSRKAVLEARAKEGDRAAASVLHLLDEPGMFLSTVQVGITLVGIAAGMYGGVSIADRLTPLLASLIGSQSYATAISYISVVAVITYLSLVFGELVPKQIALANPEKVAKFMAPPIQRLAVLFRPAVWLLDRSGDAVLSLLNLRKSGDKSVTEEEVKAIVTQAAADGAITLATGDLASRVLRLEERSVRAIMTPRADVVWLNVNEDPQQVRTAAIESNHTYFPVASENLDNALGIASIHEVLRTPSDFEALASQRELLRIPATISALQALGVFKQRGDRLALVINEHGSAEGVVSLHDIMEALVGDISGDELEEPLVTPRADGSLLVDAGINLEDLFARLGISDLRDDERSGYHSLGGFVIRQLGRVPQTGDLFCFAGHQFEVVDMDRNRVDKVLITRSAQMQD